MKQRIKILRKRLLTCWRILTAGKYYAVTMGKSKLVMRDMRDMDTRIIDLIDTDMRELANMALTEAEMMSAVNTILNIINRRQQ